ncbi:hypothetical protein RZE82_07430 [Mollicutes bacterium LVI A0039]|nr:hypothetical protein RZE82_07430 [Mollicutes bacterium LVI A0039]
MKAALMQANKIMTLVSLVVIALSLVGFLHAYVAIGFTIGYITSRLVLHKFIGQLDHLEHLQLPSSNFAFNMLVYALLFAAMGRLNVSAMLSSFVGLIAYRKLFFINVDKKL